jgi:hypothetical protein
MFCTMPIIITMPTAKALGGDTISLRVIKDSLPYILPPLTSIVNASFTNQVFPKIWKTAEVIPNPKSSDCDQEEAENSRPVSLLSILPALNQFMPYLSSHNRLTACQSGNKRWHSTETTLIKSTDIILKAMNDKKLTAVVLLDMSKAFGSLQSLTI